MDDAMAAKVGFLSDPSSYPDKPPRVETRETHFAWVFLAGERAYKMKKPSHLRGADWRTTEGRELACREELRLNRRLSAPTYLAVEPLVERGSSFRIGGSGRAVDWLLVMRRLDTRRMLDSVLDAGTLTPADLDAVLSFLIDFYKSRDPLTFTPDAYLQRLHGRIEEALSALQRTELGLPAGRTAPLAQELRATFEALRPELEERATARRIAEIHGDLRAEHVWLGPPVQVIEHHDVPVRDLPDDAARRDDTAHPAFLDECKFDFMSEGAFQQLPKELRALDAPHIGRPDGDGRGIRSGRTVAVRGSHACSLVPTDCARPAGTAARL